MVMFVKLSWPKSHFSLVLHPSQEVYASHIRVTYSSMASKT